MFGVSTDSALDRMKHLFCILFFLAVSQLAIAQKTILWKVTDTVNHKTSFILGTFHQFGNSFVDAIPEIEASLLKSDLAVFESIEQVEETRNVIAQRERSTEIEKQLSKKDLNKLKELTKDWKVDLYKLKPLEIRWKLQQEYARIVCQTSQPTDEFDQFDGYIRHLAEANKIPLKGLETNQLEIIEKGSGYPNWKAERKNISIMIKNILEDDVSNQDCGLANAYRNMELDYQFDQECVQDFINYERNNLWMKVIPDLLHTNNAFITVGYIHLKRTCGLLEQLKDQGFVVEPLEIKPVPLDGQ